MHTNELPFINGGEHITLIPEIPTWLSLIVIAATITVAAVFSLRHTARQEAKASAENHIVNPEKRGAPPETV
jgi:tellurite resistance protein TerC